jgi:hypothetical protein
MYPRAGIRMLTFNFASNPKENKESLAMRRNYFKRKTSSWWY